MLEAKRQLDKEYYHKIIGSERHENLSQDRYNDILATEKTRNRK